MHGLYSKLQEVLLIHLYHIDASDMMLLNETLNLILPRTSQRLYKEPDDLFHAPFHDIAAVTRLDYPFRAIDGLVSICSSTCHHR